MKEAGADLRIRVKRVYEPASPEDGGRFLVDRLWPRGLKRENLRLDGWLKDAAPSDKLRRWFAHDPGRRNEFLSLYFAELDARSEVCKPILKAAERGPVTLLYSAREEFYNNATALKCYLNSF